MGNSVLTYILKLFSVDFTYSILNFSTPFRILLSVRISKEKTKLMLKYIQVIPRVSKGGRKEILELIESKLFRNCRKAFLSSKESVSTDKNFNKVCSNAKGQPQ